MPRKLFAQKLPYFAWMVFFKKKQFVLTVIAKKKRIAAVWAARGYPDFGKPTFTKVVVQRADKVSGRIKKLCQQVRCEIIKEYPSTRRAKEATNG